MISGSLIDSYIVIPVIMGCFLAGYVIKHYTKISNHLIPLILMVVGIGINVVNVLSVGNPIDTLTFISGGVSGLATTGVYEMIENMVFRSKEETKPKEEKENIPDELGITEEDSE